MAAAGTRGSEGTLVGVGAALAILFLLILQVMSSSGLFGAAPVELTAISAPSATQVVTNLVVKFVNDLNNYTSQPLVGFYTNSSVVRWYGNQVPFDLNGTYKGLSNIAGTSWAVYSGFLVESHSFHSNATVSFANLNATMLNPDTVNSTFLIVVTGSSIVYGPINAQADVQQLWVNQSGNWTIHTDDWDFMFSTVPYVFTA